MCNLDARFVMVNESDKTVEMEIGFPVFVPMEEPPAFRQDVPHDPAVFIDGVRTEKFIQTGKQWGGDLVRCYISHCTFAPGETIVSVKGIIPSSGVYGKPFFRSISYIIRSGGLWKGPIGREVVTIRFPDDFNPNDYCVPRTPGFTIDGNAIRWDFSNIEPQGDGYDIHVDFVIPEAAHEIDRLLRENAEKPDDCDASLQAAGAILSATVDYYVMCFSPPYVISQDLKSRMEKRFTDPSKKERFLSYYIPSKFEKDMWVRDDTRKANPDMIRTIDGILVELGERRHNGLFQLTELGLAILEEQTRKHPDNPEIWTLYLRYYAQLSTFSISPRFTTSGILFEIPRQAVFWDAVEIAFKHCPGDPRIAAWKTFMDSKRESDDFIALQDALRAHEREFLPFLPFPYY
jgi:hypothetical protein